MASSDNVIGSGTADTDDAVTFVEALIGAKGSSKNANPRSGNAFPDTLRPLVPALRAVNCSVASVSGPEKSAGPMPNGLVANPVTIGETAESSSGSNSEPATAVTY